MKKNITVICILILALLSGCSKETDDGGKKTNSNISGNNNEKITGETSKQVLLEDVGGIYSINEKIDVQLMGNNGFIPGYCTIKDVRVTKNFEQNVSEWKKNLLDDLELDEGKITNEYSLIYIDATVENISEEDMDYNVSAIAPIIYFEGELAILSDLGYCTDKKSGKDVWLKELKAGEKLEFTVGYIINDKYMGNYDMYIDVSGKKLNPGCLLVETDIFKGDNDD